MTATTDRFGGDGKRPNRPDFENYPVPAELASAMVHAVVDPVPRGRRLRALVSRLSDGALCRALSERWSGSDVVAVERDVESLESSRDDRVVLPWKTWGGDFLELSPGSIKPFDVVFAVPPIVVGTDVSAWIVHVMHAWEFVRPGGFLVALTPSYWYPPTKTKEREFFKFVFENGWTSLMPPNLVRPPFVPCDCVVVRLEKPQEP